MERKYELYYYFRGADEWHASEDLYMLFGRDTNITFQTKDGRLLVGNEVVSSLQLGRNFLRSRWIRMAQRRFRKRRRWHINTTLLMALSRVCCRRKVCWKVTQFLRLRPRMSFFESLGYKDFVGEVTKFVHHSKYTTTRPIFYLSGAAEVRFTSPTSWLINTTAALE